MCKVLHNRVNKHGNEVSPPGGVGWANIFDDGSKATNAGTLGRLFHHDTVGASCVPQNAKWRVCRRCCQCACAMVQQQEEQQRTEERDTAQVSKAECEKENAERDPVTDLDRRRSLVCVAMRFPLTLVLLRFIFLKRHVLTRIHGSKRLGC